MAKRRRDAIKSHDLLEFVDSKSDFGFEMRVLNTLRDSGFSCEHGGTYIDPVTEKPRQFDIRALRQTGICAFRLAAEAKNLRDDFPLLISTVKRTRDEAFHDIVFSSNPNELRILPAKCRSTIMVPVSEPSAITVRLRESRSIYTPGDFVGKSADQVGRDNSGNLVAGDSEVYGKWSQAIASAADLVHHSELDGQKLMSPKCLTYVASALVVPDGTLWECRYDEKGGRLSDPLPTDRVPYFVNKVESTSRVTAGIHYSISHLEIFTLRGLRKFIEDWEQLTDELFDTETVFRKVQEDVENSSRIESAI